MGTYGSPKIGERFRELMTAAAESIDRLGSKAKRETGLNYNSACDLIDELRFKPYFNHRRPQAQVRANQISKMYEILGVPQGDIAVLLMREECAKRGLEFVYPLRRGSKLRVMGIARDPDIS